MMQGVSVFVIVFSVALVALASPRLKKSVPERCRDEHGHIDDSRDDCKKHFVVRIRQTTWHRARENCRVEQGMQLATIKSHEEQMEIDKVLLKYGENVKCKDVWLSAKDVHGEDRFVWFGEGHREALTYTHFRPNAQHPQKGKDCLAMGKDRMWYGDDCETLKAYVCEYYGKDEPMED